MSLMKSYSSQTPEYVMQVSRGPTVWRPESSLPATLVLSVGVPDNRFTKVLHYCRFIMRSDAVDKAFTVWNKLPSYLRQDVSYR